VTSAVSESTTRSAADNSAAPDGVATGGDDDDLGEAEQPGHQ